MKNDTQRLIAIRDAVHDIGRCTAAGKQEFESDEGLQRRVFECLQIIARASKSFSAKMKSRHPKIDWDKIAGMEAFLSYRDAGADPEIIWLSVEHDIPALMEEIRNLYDSFETKTETPLG